MAPTHLTAKIAPPERSTTDHEYRTGPATSTLCQGITESTGKPCRRQVGASRVFPLCRQHQDQIVTARVRQDTFRAPSNNAQHVAKAIGNVRHDTCRAYVTHPDVYANDPERWGKSQLYHYHTTIMPHRRSSGRNTATTRPAALDSREGSEDVPTTPGPLAIAAEPQHSQTVRLDSSVSVLRSTAHVAEGSTAPLTPKSLPVLPDASRRGSADRVDKRTIRNSPPRDVKSSFSFADFLSSLGCVPTRRRSPVTTSFGHSSDAVASHDGQSPEPRTSRQTTSQAKKVVRRKPVDRRTAQQAMQEAKIQQDRAEIERILTSSKVVTETHAVGGEGPPYPVPAEPEVTRETTRAAVLPPSPSPPPPAEDMVGKVRSDLQPFRASDFVRHGMTPEQRVSYYRTRYANPLDYPHKTERSLGKVRQVMGSVVQACLSASVVPSDPRTREFVYIFRLDGDYAHTPRISLKIGRSRDVGLRLRQWTAQCGLSIDRLEHFETQHAVLLERMLHLEFEEDRVLRACRCGRTHREWFDIRRDDARGRIRREFSSCPCSRPWPLGQHAGTHQLRKGRG